MNLDLARDFARLLRRKKTLDAELANVARRLDELQGPLCTEFLTEGLSSLPLALPEGGSATLYVHRQLWARAKDGDRRAVVDALRACGLTDLVREDFNTNTLSAFVREADRGGDPLPPSLAVVVDSVEEVNVRGRAVQ